MLLSWSASIEMAERYQIFLDHYSISSPENEVIFYNCTLPWFGPFCRFIIDRWFVQSLEDFVEYIFDSKSPMNEYVHMTCYVHLTCQRSLSCLDWREICDGKQDCFDGTDEKNCWQLEMNECNENEYRCSNGQCIPWEYYHDGSDHSECLDRTDELSRSNDQCYRSVAFQCEEHRCRPGNEEFPCGDGQCINEMSTCSNGRHSFLPINFCTHVALCLLAFVESTDSDWCYEYCDDDDDCRKNNCSTIYEFRKLPFLFGHVRYIVSNEIINSEGISLPDYICYNPKRCPHLSSSTVSFLNLTCLHFNQLGLRYEYYIKLERLNITIKNIFRRCLATDHEEYHYCLSSNMYQCMNSTKCISKHRLSDGIGDCPFDDDEIYNGSCSLKDNHQRFKCLDQSNENCFTFSALKNGRKDCKYGEDEYESLEAFVRTEIFFSIICDGIVHFLPIFIDGKNESDETGCEPYWQCNNTYSRCDGIWTCKDGADEVDCPNSICPSHHHSCVLPNDTSKISCLPVDRAGDDIDDCLFGTDERTKSVTGLTALHYDIIYYRLRCRNDHNQISSLKLCNNESDCSRNDDEVFCKHAAILSNVMCSSAKYNRTNVEEFLCEFGNFHLRKSLMFFKLYIGASKSSVNDTINFHPHSLYSWHSLLVVVTPIIYLITHIKFHKCLLWWSLN